MNRFGRNGCKLGIGKLITFGSHHLEDFGQGDGAVISLVYID
jgi:hypothetical protein